MSLEDLEQFAFQGGDENRVPSPPAVSDPQGQKREHESEGEEKPPPPVVLKSPDPPKLAAPMHPPSTEPLMQKPRKRIKVLQEDSDEDDGIQIITTNNAAAAAAGSSASSSSATATVRKGSRIVDVDEEDGLMEDAFTLKDLKGDDSDYDYDGEVPPLHANSPEYILLRDLLRVSCQMTELLVNGLAACDEAQARNEVETMGNVELQRRRLEVLKSFERGRCRVLRSFTVNEELLQMDAYSRLKEYQKAGVEWLLALHKMDKNGILADEMGLGKTAQALVFLSHLYFRKCSPLKKPSIVAAPASLLDNWCNEINKWAPQMRVLKYHGSLQTRTELIENFFAMNDSEEPYHLIVTTPQMLASTNDYKSLFRYIEFAYLIVDEAHSLKNADSQRHKALHRKVNSDSRLLLTGTPVQNALRELLNLYLFVITEDQVVPEQLGAALQVFADILDWQKKTRTEGKEKKGHKNEVLRNMEADLVDSGEMEPEVLCLRRMIVPFVLRRLKDEVLSDLPKKINIVERCEMRGLQRRLYQKEVRSMKSDLATRLAELGDKPDSAADKETANGKGPAEKVGAEKEGEKEQEGEGSRVKDEDEDVVMGDGENEKGGEEAGGAVDIAEEGGVGRNGETAGEEAAAVQVVDLEGGEGEAGQPEETGKKKKKNSISAVAPRMGLRSQRRSLEAAGLAVADEAAPLEGLLPEKTRRTRKGTGTGDQDGDSDGEKKEKEGDGKEGKNTTFVNSFLARLRRVCNHPLLMQHLFGDDKIQRVVTFLNDRVDGYTGHPRHRVEELVRGMSDFELHQLILDFPALKDLRIPPARFLQSAKFRRVLQLCKEHQEAGKKILLFSQFTLCLDLLETTLHFHMPELQYVRLDGSTAVDIRSELVREFSENKDVTAFLLSTRAGGLGLNLVAATSVVLIDQDWNPHTDRQAEDRVHRLGQTRDVTVYRLVCKDSLEESILHTCQQKLALDSAFGGNTAALQAAIADASARALEALEEDDLVEDGRGEQEEEEEIRDSIEVIIDGDGEGPSASASSSSAAAAASGEMLLPPSTPNGLQGDSDDSEDVPLTLNKTSEKKQKEKKKKTPKSKGSSKSEKPEGRDSEKKESKKKKKKSSSTAPELLSPFQEQ
uniref:Helicase ATP-binding domain-containing protein n=1 Tax=Chromera velia CCMP2878 TaxID=1169474 RepID=A0A0G4HQL6_9ALVE|eukprot:Cvel_7950.t1-p1 / transcript=Cvel_7950.t1 / gene=Cvel_7950 / organism=Chromera_velia_CCMP2878 / gene_product=SWI/SNF-related matrix-associated actin-dependent, putative / transcript_product=SWI/SNF-related matrix-associated actin-dependent, putative / location=Cvel_scaffold427:59822-70410(-) / protein_length=1122 / sequence_SO=supercontig / SO=protein_coding / is_pseudo=false